MTLLLLAAVCADAQGTFLYDQQTSVNESFPGYGGGTRFSDLAPPTGQSFTPALSGIDFIRISISDNNPTDGLGSTWVLNLRSTSITGPILGTTALVNLPDGFSGYPTFIFPNTISLTPGTQYFFDVNSADGGAWGLIFASFNYSGGNGYTHGVPNLAGGNYWFREGLVVPEPSSVALFVLGGCSLLWFKNRKKLEAS